LQNGNNENDIEFENEDDNGTEKNIYIRSNNKKNKT